MKKMENTKQNSNTEPKETPRSQIKQRQEKPFVRGTEVSSKFSKRK